ncbi:MAG TPA: SDR family oxidoreductase [Stackebrandtia sp.]|jgi:NAD(P)-dependent dehydrogenase (short-subunit alcohol dehydrogenase family)|uniref:SDR family NAD(P)-dependent oxidoreductase n=1 Tax=Stackebrandtia sp. TaxID=2023065 RepID=UPI002D4B95F4|nr:SDR family oxidoreductase [Stackebrandtia sp.]HZE37364.1 SDR family oxidoreductase [Stackebrandtia sp.]
MDLELTGKRALVTASSGGIGAAIAETLAAEGGIVAVHGRGAERAEAQAERIRSAGGRAETVVGDLLDPAAADRVAAWARDWNADILVNNAGPFSENDWDAADVDAWTRAMNSNVVTAVRLIRAVTPGMRERGFGRVINLGSRAATTPLSNMVDYSAAKAAVVNLTTGLASHLSGSGVTANTVSPGVIVTESMRRMFTDSAPSRGWPTDWAELEPVLAAEYAPNPSGRLGVPDDIAAAVAFLASPRGGFINGVNLRVDGGVTGVA